MLSSKIRLWSKSNAIITSPAAYPRWLGHPQRSNAMLFKTPQALKYTSAICTNTEAVVTQQLSSSLSLEFKTQEQWTNQQVLSKCSFLKTQRCSMAFTILLRGLLSLCSLQVNSPVLVSCQAPILIETAQRTNSTCRHLPLQTAQIQ